MKKLLGVLEPTNWIVITGSEFEAVQELLDKEKELGADLIVTYRNLKSRAWRWPFSLGAFLNVLTQQTTTPVLVVPNPHEVPDMAWKDSDTDSVMVVADHLTGDDDLVNWGVRMTREGGSLWLTHVEDDQTFQRYIEIIGKIPQLDTDVAREEILEQLIQEPTEYIQTCQAAIEAGEVPILVGSVVQTGHKVSDYKELVHKYRADMLIFHSRDEDQVAMHGTAYPLAVELRTLPLLLI